MRKTITVGKPVVTRREVDPATIPQQPLPVATKRDGRRAPNSYEQQGRFAWSLLHRYRGCEKAWFDLWIYFVPGGGCSCRENFKAILTEFPPDFSSPDAFWHWGVAVHNKVNAKLGKPEITIEEAVKLWRNDANEVESEMQG